VTNNEDLEKLYRRNVGCLGRYVGHVSTNVGGVYETIKTKSKEVFMILYLKAKQQEAMQWLQAKCFCFSNVVGECEFYIKI
jgi:hypothetical protein